MNAWAEAEIAAGPQLDVHCDVLPGMTSLRGESVVVMPLAGRATNSVDVSPSRLVCGRLGL
jgi:hypothetical protein